VKSFVEKSADSQSRDTDFNKHKAHIVRQPVESSSRPRVSPSTTAKAFATNPLTANR
jgi:hypothetical protein